MHALLAAVWLVVVSPIVSPGRVHHARFIHNVQQAHSDLKQGDRIDWQIPAHGKQERKMLEVLMATAEWDGWSVERKGRRILLTPPASELTAVAE